MEVDTDWKTAKDPHVLHAETKKNQGSLLLCFLHYYWACNVQNVFGWIVHSSIDGAGVCVWMEDNILPAHP